MKLGSSIKPHKYGKTIIKLVNKHPQREAEGVNESNCRSNIQTGNL